MKRYAEFTKLERANMSREEVKDLLKYELMDAGIVSVEKPPESTAKKPEIPTTTFYQPVLTAGYERSIDILFRSSSEAEEFLELCPLYMEYNYNSGNNVFIEPTHTTVRTVECVSKKQKEAMEPELKAYEEQIAEEKRLTKEYDDYVKLSEGAVSHIWEDWHKKREALSCSMKITENWVEYVDTCNGDEDIAMKFFLKAYSRSEIEEAFSFLELVPPIITEKSHA